MLFVVLCPGTPKGSTGSGSGFKARLKVSSDRLGEAFFIIFSKLLKCKKNIFWKIFENLNY